MYNAFLSSLKSDIITKDNILDFYFIASIFNDVFSRYFCDCQINDLTFFLPLEKRIDYLQENVEFLKINYNVYQEYRMKRLIFDSTEKDDLYGVFSYENDNWHIKLNNNNNISNVITGIHEITHYNIFIDGLKSKTDFDYLSETFAYANELKCLIKMT